MDTRDSVEGCVLGLAFGDALGLPFEGLSRRRVAKYSPGARHRLIGSWGMVSDDTDHAEIVLRALAASAGGAAEFERSLAGGLRRWFLGLPAGVGLATARSCIMLCVGVSPSRSGVFSAGNGPLMRAPVLGAAIRDDGMLASMVQVSTRITHTDPLAEEWAGVVARSAAWDGAEGAARWMEAVIGGRMVDARTLAACERVAASVAAGETTESFAMAMDRGRGVTGFVLDSGPVALHAALSHPRDLVGACLSAIRCGGDTDTTAAIAGGIVGAWIGAGGIVADREAAVLLERVIDWPRGIERLRRAARIAADSVVSGRASSVTAAPFPLVLARNLVFLGIVLGHGFRRLGPPW